MFACWLYCRWLRSLAQGADISTRSPTNFLAERGLLVSERQADPSDDGIPLTVFRGWIIYQDAIHVFVGPVTAVVPRSPIANAGHCEETWRHPLVLNTRRWMLLCKKSGR